MLNKRHFGWGIAMRTSEPGNSVYLDVGIWYDAERRNIHMTAKGVHGFHTTVRSNADSKRGHPNLFWKLAACLRRAGAPAPQDGKLEGKAAETAPKPTSPLDLAASVPPTQPGEMEWARNRLGKDTHVRLLVTGRMGTREIGNLIRLLETQRDVLEEDDSETKRMNANA